MPQIAPKLYCNISWETLHNRGLNQQMIFLSMIKYKKRGKERKINKNHSKPRFKFWREKITFLSLILFFQKLQRSEKNSNNWWSRVCWISFS